MICKSRPSFVEPEPRNFLIPYHSVQSPKDDQEIYKFPLLRDKQSKRFSFNLNNPNFFTVKSPVSTFPATLQVDAKLLAQNSFSVHFK
jgi:hypothetical protein